MRFSLAAAMSLAAFPLTALAQPGVSPLGQIIVTTARTPEPLRTTIASVTIITSAEIARLQPRSVADLLNGLAGISLANDGGLGKSTSVYLRGTDADQVLVLIDGVKVGSATTGTPAWEQFPVSQIQRIVIVRGPYSSLYGSGAIGGVIEIFTRHGSPGAPAVPSFTTSAGSHGTYRVELGQSGSIRHGWYNASLSGIYTHGIPICATGAPITAACYTTTPQHGYWSGSAALRGGYRLREATATFDFLRTECHTRYDGNIYSGDESRIAQQVLGATVSASPLHPLRMSIALGQSKDLSEEYFNSAPDGYFDTTRNTASWINRFAIGARQQLVFGVDYEHDSVSSDTSYAIHTRYDAGEFALYQWLLGRAELQFSGRHDHNQQFGNHDTWSAQSAYRITRAIRLTAAYGTAFKAPTFNDLYFPFYGDPALHPETSHSVELGLSGTTRQVTWKLNAYDTRIVNLIEYDPLTFTAANVGKARIRGLEAQLSTVLAGWRVELQLTSLDPRDTAVNAGKLLPRIARFTGRLDLDRTFGAFHIGATIFADGPRFEDPANTQRLGGYETLDLRAGWQFRPRWQLQALLSNALGHSYETALYYNQPDRSAYLTLRYTPSVVR